MKLRLVAAACALLLSGCNIQAQPFANGASQMLGTVSVAMEVQPNPPRAGQSATLAFTVRGKDGAIGTARGVCELMLDMPKMPMNMSPMMLDTDANGRCQTTYTFPMAGGWSAAMKVKGQEGAEGEAKFDFDVGP